MISKTLQQRIDALPNAEERAKVMGAIARDQARLRDAALAGGRERHDEVSREIVEEMLLADTISTEGALRIIAVKPGLDRVVGLKLRIQDEIARVQAEIETVNARIAAEEAEAGDPHQSATPTAKKI